MAAVVVGLAIGIGLNVALFSVVDALLLRPPSGIRDAESLRRLVIPVVASRPGTMVALGRGFALGDLERLSARPATFTAVAAERYPVPSALGSSYGRPIRVAPVTGEWFPLLGVRAQRGRLVQPSDDRLNAPAVGVLSDRLWRTAFGADPDVVGRRIRLSGGSLEIVGIASPEFTGLGVLAPDIWIAAAHADVVGTAPGMLGDRNVEWFSPVVRLAPGVSDVRALTEVSAVLRTRDEELPATGWQARQPGGAFRRAVIERLAGRRSAAMPLDGGMSVSLWLFAATGAVLLVTCANAAGLILTRGERRRLEFSTRAALGEPHTRLARELLAETLVLSSCSAAIGLALSSELLKLFQLLPRAPHIGDINWHGAAAAATLAACATLVAGTGPAVLAANSSPIEVLRPSSSAVIRRRHRWNRGIVAGQLAASLVLLMIGGLSLLSLRRLEDIDLGIDAYRLSDLVVPVDSVLSPASVDALREAAIARAVDVPGVLSAAAAASPPIGPPLMISADLPEHEDAGGGATGKTFAMAVDRRYFSTTGIAMRAGRGFTLDDRAGGPPVLVVSERFARTYWPDKSALTRCVELISDNRSQCARVVGVAADVRFLSPTEPAPPLLYLPLTQYRGHETELHIVIRVRGDPQAASAPLEKALRAEGGPFAEARARPVAEGMLSLVMEPYRLTAWALGVFAALAVVIAAVGLYAAVAYSVSQRTSEFGIRLALGARPQDVVWMVVRATSRLAIAGLAAGSLATVVITYALRNKFYGVRPWDPTVIALVAAILLLVTLFAAWMPARRAARADPALVIRAQ